MRLLFPLLLATGCAAKTVTVAVPSQAAVEVDTRRVAVVAGDPACRGVAQGITRELGSHPEIVVDPLSTTRVAVVGCSESMVPTVSIQSDGHRTHGWEGRSSVLLVVEAEGESVGRLIGTAGDSTAALPTRRGPLHRALEDELVADVTEQLAPSGLVERRVYPQASPDSSRGLQTRAVAAEAQGDVSDALELAQAAHSLTPTPQLAAYIDELERRLLLTR
ncbi:MAG: hypothetical protein EP330_00365 [Deltaproteobacteria bacterium]|nr:MAG: hypothetical protein EP330_00365 [Deltaproteobacteria bacterium]